MCVCGRGGERVEGWGVWVGVVRGWCHWQGRPWMAAGMRKGPKTATAVNWRLTPRLASIALLP